MAETVRDLGNGLNLRWSTAADADRLAEFIGRVFGSDNEPDRGLQDLVLRLMGDNFPFMGPGDFALVEDTDRADTPIVACTCYLREEWDFDGIPIPVARPEIVGSDKDYRRKGLIRAVFDLLHERSTTDGTLLQGITGIPYFYRQFGYEYALDLEGGSIIPASLVPDLPDGEEEAYHLRRATEADVPAIAECYRRNHQDSLVSLRMPDDYWSYNVAAEDEPLQNPFRMRVIESKDGEFCGFVALPPDRANDTIGVRLAGFVPGVDLQSLAPALVRALRDATEDIPARKPDVPLRKISLALGRDHPLCLVLPQAWSPQVRPPYAWYLRIPNIPAFLRHIAPVLEARLEASPFAGRTGDIAIDLYREGLRLTFEDGRLTAVENYETPTGENPAKAGFPPLPFITLLVGYRSLAELRANYPDVWANNEVGPVLDVLFPKRASHLFGT